MSEKGEREMTKPHIDFAKLRERIDALERGERLQMTANDVLISEPEYYSLHFVASDRVRIRPEPQEVTITADDLPGEPFWVTIKGRVPSAPRMVEAVDHTTDRIRVDGVWFTLHYAMIEGHQYSTNRKGPWKSFSKLQS